MNGLYLLGLILILNGYIGAVIYLSQCKNKIVGLLLPSLAGLVTIIQAIKYSRVSPQNLNTSEGVSLICLLILSIFGFILYIITRYGNNKGN